MVDIDISNLEFRIQPQVLTKLSSLSESSEINYIQLEKVIQSDQNLVGVLLKMVNSSFYSRGNTISSLKTALSILGFKLIKTLAMTFSTQMIFSGSTYTRFNKYVWKHSIVTAILCKWLNDKKNIADPEIVFLAGILHDIGKVVLSETDRKAFINVINDTTESGNYFHVIEKKYFQVDHNEAGEKIVESWNLSKDIGLACKYHELDSEIPADLLPRQKGLLQVLRVANYLSHKLDYGHLAYAEDDLAKKVITELGFNASNIEGLLQEAQDFLEVDDFSVYFLKKIG